MSWRNLGRTEGPDPITVHLDRDSSLEKRDGYADSIAHSYLSHNPFQPAKRSAFQSNSLTDSQRWPRHCQEARTNDELDRSYFAFINWHGFVSYTDDVEKSHRGQERQAVIKIESAEQITRKKRQVHRLVAIRQTPPTLIERQELL